MKKKKKNYAKEFYKRKKKKRQKNYGKEFCISKIKKEKKVENTKQTLIRYFKSIPKNLFSLHGV